MIKTTDLSKIKFSFYGDEWTKFLAGDIEDKNYVGKAGGYGFTFSVVLPTDTNDLTYAKTRGFRYDNIKELADSTFFKEDRYFSLNAFKLYRRGRKASNLSQYRCIGIDLDGYKKGFTADEVVASLIKEIENGNILAPNLITKSHGVQFLYSLERGVKCTKDWAKLYHDIIRVVNKKLEYLAADSQVNEPARIFRVPGTLNTKVIDNITNVEWAIFHEEPYNIQEIKAFYYKDLEVLWKTDYEAKSLKKDDKKSDDKSKTSKEDKEKDTKKLVIFKNFHKNLVHDIPILFEIRGDGMIGTRNIATYDLAFSLGMLKCDYNYIYNNVIKRLSKYINQDFSLTEVERTIKSAYSNVKNYLNALATGTLVEGVIRPKGKDKLYTELKITRTEQESELLWLFLLPEAKKRRDQAFNRLRVERFRARKRAENVFPDGSFTLKEYRIHQLAVLLKFNPYWTNKQYATELNVSVTSIKRWKAAARMFNVRERISKAKYKVLQDKLAIQKKVYDIVKTTKKKIAVIKKKIKNMATRDDLIQQVNLEDFEARQRIKGYNFMSESNMYVKGAVFDD